MDGRPLELPPPPPRPAVVTCRLRSLETEERTDAYYPRRRTQQNATFRVVEEARMAMASTATSPDGRRRRAAMVTASVERARSVARAGHRRRIDGP